MTRCQYCGHSAGPDAAMCQHCGGPLPAEASEPRTGEFSSDVLPGAAARYGSLGKYLTEVGKWSKSIGAAYSGTNSEPAGSAGAGSNSGPAGNSADNTANRPHVVVTPHLPGTAEGKVAPTYSKQQWWTAAVLFVVVLALLLFLIIKLGPLAATPPTGLAGNVGPGMAADPVAALPVPLQGASCQAREESDGASSCVLAADSPLLFGGITGGRALTFQVQTVASAPLGQTIAQWRSAGGEVVADGEVFAVISASSAVWFADTNSGLRVDTGAFASGSGARTFLARSGLLQP